MQFHAHQKTNTQGVSSNVGVKLKGCSDYEF